MTSKRNIPEPGNYLARVVEVVDVVGQDNVGGI